MDYWMYDYYCLFLLTDVVEQIIAREVGPAFSFSRLQEPLTGPCPYPDESSLYPPVLFLWDIFYYSFPCMSTRWSTVFPSAFPTMLPTSNAFCMPHPSNRPVFGNPNEAIFGETPHNAYLFICPFVTSQSPPPAVPNLIMSGAIPLLPLYANMAWTGTTFPLLFTFILCLYYLMLHIFSPKPSSHTSSVCALSLM